MFLQYPKASLQTKVVFAFEHSVGTLTWMVISLLAVQTAFSSYFWHFCIKAQNQIGKDYGPDRKRSIRFLSFLLMDFFQLSPSSLSFSTHVLMGLDPVSFWYQVRSGTFTRNCLRQPSIFLVLCCKETRHLLFFSSIQQSSDFPRKKTLKT